MSLNILSHSIDVSRDEVIWDNVPKLVEPKEGELSQDTALVRDTLSRQSRWHFV